MSKFDKYGRGDKPVLPSHGSVSPSLPVDRRVAAAISKVQSGTRSSEDASRLIFGTAGHVAIALDATGSMAGLLE
ncbi:MAG: hypothetical protein ABL962_08815, partial [Fimbriimonadaceae bacterium]